ncbi:MAG: T9SS type A sorting domain-containing protein [Tannerella sp.]|jgi:hypothetical protein|nr:T9SS type A sorting domain-containing protein [Tannerella sp.]
MKLKEQIRMRIIGLLLLGSPWLFVLPAQAREASQALPPVSVHAPSATGDTLKASVNVADNHIIVSDAPAKSRLEIYNIVGVKVKEIEIKSPSEEYIVSLPRGYYIVRIGEIIRKIVIR